MPAASTREIRIHWSLVEPDGSLWPVLRRRLATRRQEMAGMLSASQTDRDSDPAPGQQWLTRSYPVLSILAPALIDRENKVEYPGDPMCLYAALSVAIASVQAAKNLRFGGEVYGDLCPRWNDLPARSYRLAPPEYATDHEHPLNTDQTVLDLRVWNSSARDRTKACLLAMRPSVVLISTVSPAHRYALEIARLVRDTVENALIVLGGRHIDETLGFDFATRQPTVEYSNPLDAQERGVLGHVLDFMISGDGYYALDHLMQAISASMDLRLKIASVTDVVRTLKEMSAYSGPVKGRGVIAAVQEDCVDFFPFCGAAIDSTELPSPYDAFAIRARFPIFLDESGSIQRTAHIMTVGDGVCPLACSYCSESVTVSGPFRKQTSDAVGVLLRRIAQLAAYGAEALFFDDPIFWGGNVKHMLSFCESFGRMKEECARGEVPAGSSLTYPDDRRRITQMQWAAQLTVDFLSGGEKASEKFHLLEAFRSAGGTYLYFGIESMAESVMLGVHKHRRRPDMRWKDKVREALQLVRSSGIRAGASVLFGLEGESRATIQETIEEISNLIQERLLFVVSPNILTYHPGAKLTAKHAMQQNLDYVTVHPSTQSRPPYCYFEEAHPGVISKLLTEEDLWYIYHQSRVRWTHSATAFV
jgi:radical SAM superfamily enzyme YgiQ (UPF0313 family)